MDKNIFLSGGGGAGDSILLDKQFISVLKTNKILYIPIAMETNSVGFEGCFDWISNTLSKISNNFLDIEMWTDLESKLEVSLEQFSAIYIGGGNTYKLLQNLNESGFITKLIKYINNGGLVYGGSAGAIIFGKSIEIVVEENDKNYKYADGFDLLNGYSVHCHYEEKLCKKIINYSNKSNQPVIALTERTGLNFNGKIATVIGFDPVIVFKNSKQEIIKVGQTFQL